MTECLLCKGQIEDKSSFLRLFLLKEEGPSCCSTCYQNLNAYLKSIALAVFATGNQIYVQIAKNGRKRGIKSSISHYLPIMKQ